MESMQAQDPGAFAAIIAEVEAFNAALVDADVLRFAGGLQPPSTAKTVDATGEQPEVAHAPFVEASSYVGGFWVIETDTEEDAVRWATRASAAVQSRIEVRALQEAPPA
jgi:hypothetical protein